jgi:hypothetical protein
MTSTMATRSVGHPSAVDASDRAQPGLERLLSRMGDPLDPADYDWTGAELATLDEDEVFALTYAAQVEWGTEGTFESLAGAGDPLVDRFLETWLAQEVVHAELLVRFLELNGHAVAAAHRTPQQRRAAARGRRLNRIARRIWGRDFAALHMTWGAVNELTTLRFYGVLRRRTQSSLLRDLLRDVMAQEALHYAFYRDAAASLLANRPRGRRRVRWAMTHLWSPVGVGLRSAEDADRLVLSLLGDSPGLVRSLDATLASLPGLDGTSLVGTTVAAARQRM